LIATQFEWKFKYSSGLEFELNSKEIWEFDWVQSLTKVIRVQVKYLIFEDVTTLSLYRNLVLRFRGEVNPRVRIGTRYLNQGKEVWDSRGEVISWSVGSLSFGRRAMKVYMMPCWQGREWNIFWWWIL
jgi:hypothetical protein